MTGRACYRCGATSTPATVNGILVDAPGWSTVTVTGLPITNSLVCDGCATAVRRLLATPPDVAERKADAAREDAFRRGYDDGRADALAGVGSEDGAA